MRRLGAPSSLVTLLVILTAQLAAVAAAPLELFQPVTAAPNANGAAAKLAGAAVADTSSSSGVALVSVKSKALASNPGEISLYLAPGVTVTAVQRADLAPPPGSNVLSQWVGEVKGFPGALSTVVLSANPQGQLSGIVQWLDPKVGKIQKYKVMPESSKGKINKSKEASIKPTAKLLTAITQVKEMPRNSRGIVVPPTATAKALSVPPANSFTPAANNSSGGGGGRRLLGAFRSRRVLIDVLLVATDAAVFAAGGWDAMRTTMTGSMTMASKALADSGVSARLRVASMQQLFTEADGANELLDAGTVLSRLKDGDVALRFNHVTTWRTTFGADLVMLFTALPGNGGLAYINGKNIASKSGAMFSLVLASSSITAGYALANNVAYNLGCGSHASDRTGQEYARYAVGWRLCHQTDKRKRYHTIMSPPCPDVASVEIGQFSRPEGRYRGLRTGNKRDGNCAAALRRTASTVGNFRRRPVRRPTQRVVYTLTLFNNLLGTSLVLTDTWRPTSSTSAGTNVWAVADLADPIYGVIGFSNQMQSFSIQLDCTNYDCPTALGELRIVFWDNINFGDGTDELGYDVLGYDSYDAADEPLKSGDWASYCTTTTTTSSCTLTVTYAQMEFGVSEDGLSYRDQIVSSLKVYRGGAEPDFGF